MIYDIGCVRYDDMGVDVDDVLLSIKVMLMLLFP